MNCETNPYLCRDTQNKPLITIQLNTYYHTATATATNNNNNNKYVKLA